jgi:hypothetical protein
MGTRHDLGSEADSNQLMYKNIANPKHPNPCHLIREDWQLINIRTAHITGTQPNPDNTLTVMGTGMGWLMGTATLFNGTQTIPLQINSWSDTQLIVVLPANVTGGAINYATANGQTFK